jgi:hypothetical protein
MRGAMPSCVPVRPASAYQLLMLTANNNCRYQIRRQDITNELGLFWSSQDCGYCAGIKLPTLRIKTNLRSEGRGKMAGVPFKQIKVKL